MKDKILTLLHKVLDCYSTEEAYYEKPENEIEYEGTDLALGLISDDLTPDEEDIPSLPKNLPKDEEGHPYIPRVYLVFYNNISGDKIWEGCMLKGDVKDVYSLFPYLEEKGLIEKTVSELQKIVENLEEEYGRI